jgi:hypothetical protein
MKFKAKIYLQKASGETQKLNALKRVETILWQPMLNEDEKQNYANPTLPSA